MKKIIILVLFALVSVASYSQVSWNAKAGMNISNITNMGGKEKIGFSVGVGMEYALKNRWYIQPSLLLSTKGTRGEIMEMGYTMDATFNPIYIELPIMAAVKLPVSDKCNLVISVGPYLAYGVGGKATVEAKSGGVSVSAGTDVFNSDKDEYGNQLGFNAFDFGLGTGLAFEFRKFFIGFNCSFGLTALQKGVDENSNEITAKNTNSFIGVGYKF